ncbi:MAG: amidohydrolase family protein [Acidobacteriota bacterium]|nr:amidohydrolase family protein [Acidobacteriota bacterium]
MPVAALAAILFGAVAAHAYHIDDGDKLAPEALLIRNATVWTQGPDGILENADVLVRDGKIRKIGNDLSAPDGAVVIDAAGKHVTPGLIDCHSHMAIRGGVNEGTNNITAEVRISDVVDPEDIDLYRALAGGLTAAHLLHGSANSVGGQDAVIKLRWNATADELLVEDAAPGIKFALGENPKRSNARRPGTRRYPATRMGVNQSIRERFLAARDYMREWEEYEALSDDEQARSEPPRVDLQLEAIAEILRGERVIHSHSYRQDEILALIRVAEEMGIRIGTFQHVLEGYKVADEIAAHGAGASTFSDWWAYKLEAYDAIPYNGALMYDRDVLVSFNSDSSELARRMNLEAAKAVKYGGVPEAEALGFVTINAAKQLGIDHRTGSLEKGKDADLVIWSGDPLSVYSTVEQTWVDGVREFDRATDEMLREAVALARTEAIELIKAGDKKEEDDEAEEEQETEEDKEDEVEEEGEQEEEDADSSGPGWTHTYHDRLATLGQTVSIVHATVHTMTGETIEDGTVSFRNGRIVAVGAGLPPLDDAEVLEVAGRHLYPGMIDASSSLGLTEIGSVAGSVDVSEIGEINPEINTAIAVNPDSELIPVSRAAGLTHVLTVPGGGLVSGTSALIRLDGWTWEDLAAVSPAGMHIRWPSFRIRRGPSFFGPPESEEDQKKRRKEQLDHIDDLFDDARAYALARRADGNGGKRAEIDPALEAMLPVIDGEIPVILHAGEVRQIRSAVEWAGKQGLASIVAGNADLWRVTDLLVDSGVPVIVTSVLNRPTREDEPYDTPFVLPARLHEAGVRFCISTGGGGFGTSNGRNLPYHAAMAAAFGLDREEAVRSITRYPAEILGVGDDLGTIEVGKSASLVMTDGDLLEIRTNVLRVFIDGRAVDVEDNKQYRLYDKYRHRPRVGTSP